MRHALSIIYKMRDKFDVSYLITNLPLFSRDNL